MLVWTPSNGIRDIGPVSIGFVTCFTNGNRVILIVWVFFFGGERHNEQIVFVCQCRLATHAQTNFQSIGITVEFSLALHARVNFLSPMFHLCTSTGC